MLTVAGQTAEPNGLKFIEGTLKYPRENIGKSNLNLNFFLQKSIFSHGQRRALQLVDIYMLAVAIARKTKEAKKFRFIFSNLFF